VKDFGEVGVGTALRWDTRNHVTAASRGALLYAEGNYYPAVWTAKSAFGEAHGEAQTFFSARGGLAPTLALRVAGKKVWGTYPLHEGAFIGGPDSLRGLSVQRYAGDAALVANSELRVRMFGFKVLVPTDVGLFALADAGRVWLAGESSERWHTGVGGGVWMSFLRRENMVSVALARSEGRTRAYLGAGFGF
jgi:hemolysin activation/secretion protein